MIVAFLYIFAVLEVGYGLGVFLRSQDAILVPLAIGFGIGYERSRRSWSACNPISS
jgi:hypothetical protein